MTLTTTSGGNRCGVLIEFELKSARRACDRCTGEDVRASKSIDATAAVVRLVPLMS